MRFLLPILFVAAGCWGNDAYILRGVVVDKPDASHVVVAHEDIEGLMPAMTMPFSVDDPGEIAEVEPGDRIVARLRVQEDRSWLARVRVVGEGPVPAAPSATLPPAPVVPGEALGVFTVPVHAGGTWTVGPGQGHAMVLSFVYTRCPLPEFCPATILRMQALQAALAADGAKGPRILLVTLDPEYDTVEVLAEYAAAAGADPEVWGMGRVDADPLSTLAARAGIPVMRQDGEILHALRTLVLDPEGRLIERYDDNNWPLERVVEQLRTGGPPAPPHTSGTLTPKPE